MRRPSPARFLAPLALLACALAIWLIVRPGGDTGSTASSATTSTSTAARSAKRPKPSSSNAKKPSATSGASYTVKNGDTLSGIAQTTGKTVQELLDLNAGLDANTMQVGQRIKLGG